MHLTIAVSVAAACYFAFSFYIRTVGLPLTQHNFRHGSRRGIQNKDADEEAGAYVRRLKGVAILFIALVLLVYVTTEIFESSPF